MDVAEVFLEQAGRELRQVISLAKTIEHAGLVSRERAWMQGEAHEYRLRYLLPRLCACPWRSRLVRSSGVQIDGTVEYQSLLGVTRAQTAFPLRPGHVAADSAQATRGSTWTTIVPVVPEQYQPSDEDWILLFEAEWQLALSPHLFGNDPILLRPLGGDHYSLEAAWSMSERELEAL